MRAQGGLPARGDIPPDQLSLDAGTWMAFVPMVGEPNIVPLLHARLARGGTVCLPRLDVGRRSMDAVVVSSLEQDTEAMPGKPRVRQARAGLPILSPEELNVVLVPGLAFDRRGRRLGRGAGYYDRFLARLTGPTQIIGVCFDEQIVDDVPVEPHDVRMHVLLTPSGLIPISPDS